MTGSSLSPSMSKALPLTPEQILQQSLDAVSAGASIQPAQLRDRDQNSFATIARMMDSLTEHDIAMEFECYDVGHLYVLEHHLSKRTVKKPVILQFLTGTLGGISSEIDHLLHLKRTSERIFGKDLVLFTHGTGTGNIKAAAFGAMMGTHLRVGQEDNLFERPGVPFASNAAQVEKIVRVLREFDLEPATPEEARAILGLPAQAR
ncbi:3-keto-5-aminohexanoate cleavage protein (plasmid) [Bradyrhizobium sp. 195]|nr:3-keto-5-aminohexanoate cleavage protein [Bradyrhizobium sp. 195]